MQEVNILPKSHIRYHVTFRIQVWKTLAEFEGINNVMYSEFYIIEYTYGGIWLFAQPPLSEFLVGCVMLTSQWLGVSGRVEGS